MTLAETVTPLLLLTLLCGSGLVWCRIIRRWKNGKRALPFHHSELARWGLLDVIVLLLSITACLSILTLGAKLTGFVEFPRDEQSARDVANSMLLPPVAEVLGIAVALAFIGMRTRSSLRKLGWSTRRVRHDLRLGVAAFLAIAVPTYVVLDIATRLYRNFWPEQTHPLIKLLQDSPSGYFFLLGCVSAVLLAPLAEEVMFRVIVQGWLESVAEKLSRGENWLESLLAVDPHAGRDSAQKLTRPRHWPIAATSALFAIAHLGHGPAPIPLFVFSMGLGYLYQYTHRVLPCIIVHMTLNGLTMILLWLQTSAA